MLRMLYYLFWLLAVGLFCLAAYQGWYNYHLLHSPGAIHTQGRISGYYRELSVYHDTSGQDQFRIWFPQVEIRYRNTAGKTLKAVDPGFLLFEYYQRDERVPLVVTTVPTGSSSARVLIDDFPARYGFWSLAGLLGLVLMVLLRLAGEPDRRMEERILDRSLLKEGQTASTDHLPPGLAWLTRVRARSFLRAFFILGVIVLLLVFSEHIRQLIPGGKGEDLYRAAEAGRNAQVQRLLEEGADPNFHMQPTGFTPLMAAFYNHHPDSAGLLLQAEFDPQAKDSVGRTLTWFAVRAKDERGVARLLELGAPVACSCEDLLASAIALRKPGIARLLIDHGHPLDRLSYTGNNKSYSAGDIAILTGQPDIVRLLDAHGGVFTAPHEFVDAANGQSKSGKVPVARYFGSMSLRKWWKIVREAEQP